MPRYFAAAAAKLVPLVRAPFATGRPVSPLRRVEAVLIMLFTPAPYPAFPRKQVRCFALSHPLREADITTDAPPTGYA